MASVPPRMPERRRGGGNVRALVSSMIADYVAPPRRVAYRDASGAWVTQCGGLSVYETIYQAAAAPGVVVSGEIVCGQVYASLAAYLPIGAQAATVIVNLRKR